MRRIQTGIVGVDGCTCLPLDLHHGGPVNKTFLSWCPHSSVDSSAPSILPYSNSDRRSRRRALWPFDHHHHGPTYFSLLKVQFSDKIIRALECQPKRLKIERFFWWEWQKNVWKDFVVVSKLTFAAITQMLFQSKCKWLGSFNVYTLGLSLCLYNNRQDVSTCSFQTCISHLLMCN